MARHTHSSLVRNKLMIVKVNKKTIYINLFSLIINIVSVKWHHIELVSWKENVISFFSASFTFLSGEKKCKAQKLLSASQEVFIALLDQLR